MTRERTATFHTGIALLIGGIIAATATATSAEETEIGEIVVTAQKRATNLEDVPLAIAVLTEGDLVNMRITDTVSLGRQVPNLQIDSPWGYANPGIFLRGIGNGDVNAPAEAKVGVYSDQVFNGLLVGQNFQMYDIERVEVLRGPQGTLYGKNTTGGLINVINRKPDGSTNGYVTLSGGNYQAHTEEGAFGFPLGEHWSARIAGVKHDREGVAVNTLSGRRLNDVDDYNVRGFLRYRSDVLTALLRVQAGGNDTSFRQGKADTSSSPTGASVAGYVDPDPSDPFRLTSDVDTFMRVSQKGVALTLDWSLRNYTVTSITTWDQGKLHALQDADQSAKGLIQIGWRTDSSEVAQELRIANDAGNRFVWMAGAFYYDQRIKPGTGSDFELFRDAPHPPFSTLDIKQDMAQKSRGGAGFADGTVKLNDQWSINGGIRYTSDHKQFHTVAQLVRVDGAPTPPGIYTVPFTAFDKTWDAATGHLGLEWRPTKDLLFYGAISRGFNSGGFNGGAIADPGEAVAFNPEYLNSAEVGMKSVSFERRLQLNIDAFYYDYKDVQVQTITTSPFSNNFIQITENASNAKIYGAEAELTGQATDYLRISASLGLLHSEYVHFKSIIANESGHPLPMAPQVTFVGSVHYERPAAVGKWFVHGEWNHTSQQFYNSSRDSAVSSGGAHDLLSARIGWNSPGDRWRVALWGENLGNEVYTARALDLVGAFGFVSRWFNDPRTYGLELTYRFQ